MTNRILTKLLCASALVAVPLAANAVDLEITHWWTSGGEAAAVRALAEQFEATSDNTWVDGAIAGSGGVARPIIISRILGGDPMAATQLNHGQQAVELIEAGLMLDLTDIAEAGDWANIVNPPSLLEACTVEGRVYCVPLNIHSPQWMWTSLSAFDAAGVAPAQNWDDLKAAAPALREAGKQPLVSGAQGWQYANQFNTFVSGLGGEDLYYAVYRDGDEAALMGTEMKAIWDEIVITRDLMAGTAIQDWNLATAEVINGNAAAQVMGDWAQGEFAVAGKTAGSDYDCIIGMGRAQLIATAGDAFYFPVNKDEEVTAAQKELAQVLISPEAQVTFNLKKGSLPVRGDIDMSTAGTCMQKGLAVLADGGTIDSSDMLLSPDAVGQIQDMLVDFYASDMSAEDAQAEFAKIVMSDK
ncbi:putative sugar-binding periplasmic protein precursor [Aquimixticola soesokkakensis]|uniref:Probable sugar-binding periplasmic protein n=1 Tax=Aquimixticola soesokkakensis TaxID=1519096 RepID=A0A1Y5RM85_9RHOB|nr:ABC transporter substrate-binding protein [Aquimixticola soesokkakensis]SLN19647.1 putative sugar-binding periplasmic protein precursor [Aquimixticola soesokkakensis]